MRRLFPIATAISTAICIITIALFVRSMMVTDSVAHTVQNGPVWLIRSFHGRISFEHRSFWDQPGGWRWDRRWIRFFESMGPGLYQDPKHNYGVFDVGYFSGANHTWPGHLYPNVRPLPGFHDPRWERDDYSALILPDFLFIGAFAVLPWIYFHRRMHKLTPAFPRVWPPRRMNVLASLSLLLFLILSEIWLRSYGLGNMWWRGTEYSGIEWSLDENRVSFVLARRKDRASSLWPVEIDNVWHHTTFMPHGIRFTSSPTLLNRLGFAYRARDVRYPYFRMVVVPLWPAWLLSAVLPIRWLLQCMKLRKRQLRIIRGQCLACGYSLTANTTGVCPECGIAISALPRSHVAFAKA